MSGTDYAPRDRGRHRHQHQNHSRTQEPRFATMRFQVNFASTIFGEEVWNDGKRHVLYFGSIRHKILFEAAKLLKIGPTDFKGFL